MLTDADLTRLVDALAEGRAMWARVRDAVAVLVGGNAGEVAFTVIGTALGGRSPLGTRGCGPVGSARPRSGGR